MLLLPDTLQQRSSALREALEAGDLEAAATRSVGLSSGRVAQILAETDPDHAAELLRLVPPERAGQVLGAMSSERAADLLAALSEEEATTLFRAIRPEYAADIYCIWSKQDEEWADRILDRLAEDERELVRRIMTAELVAVRDDHNALDACRLLRNRGFKLLTTFTDITGVSIYLGLSTLFLTQILG